MAKKRNPRADRAVRDALADLIRTEFEDPRLQFVSFTDVQVTPDHEHVIVYYTTLDPSLVSPVAGDRLPAAGQVAAALDAVSPRLRGQVARRARLRTTPTLRFEPDPVAAHAARVEELLHRLGEAAPDADPDA